MRDAAFADLIGTIYDAAAGDAPWRAVGQGLTRLLGAASGSLMVGDIATSRFEVLYHGDFPADAVAAYRRHYRKVDLWTNRAAAMVARARTGAPRVLMNGELLVPDRELLASEFYNDFGRKLGLRYVVGTVAPAGAAGSMPIGLHRPDGARPFGATERRLLEATLPHLQRALQIRHHLGSAVAPPSAAALDALTLGLVVVDASGRVVHANLAAEALAAGGGALRFTRPGALGGPVQVRPERAAEAGSLAALIAATAAGGPGGALRLSGAAGGALAVLVAPLPRRLAGALHSEPGRALLMLRELGEPVPGPRLGLLRELFGLTRAEAEVALALTGGATKAAVAAARGLRETTIRSQVRAVLEKTGTANLRDLEGLLASLRGL